jgi:hypothetical protein
VEIKSHDEGVLSLESRLDELLDLADKIQSANGMSKSFALEALKIIPSFNNNIPTAYYTNEPTIAQYAVSLESLISTVWEMIVAAGAAVIAMIRKFIDWLFPKKKEDGITSEDMDELVKEQNRRAKIFNDIDKMLKTGVIAVEDSSSGKSKSLNEILDEYVSNDGANSELAELMRVRDPMFYDIINHKEYTKAIKSTNRVIPILPVDVSNQTEEYLKFVKNIDMYLKSMQPSYTNDYPFKIAEFKPIMIDMFGFGKQMTIGEGVTAINEVREVAMKIHPPVSTISFTKINEMFAKAVNQADVSNILKKIENVKNHLEDLLDNLSSANQSIERMAKYGNVDEKITSKYGRILKDAFKITRTDVVDCFNFFKEIMEYTKLVVKVDAKLRHVQMTALRIIEAEISHGGKVPSEFSELTTELRKAPKSLAFPTSFN